MKSQFPRVISVCFFLFLALAASANAQPASQVFTLPDARSGEGYRVELETVLRDRYGLRLESGTRNAIIQWTIADGDLPAGISVHTDGTIIGQPEAGRTDPYRFRLRVVDVSVKDEELVLDFTLAVKAGRLRLSKIEGPRLVPVNIRESATTENLRNESKSPAPANNVSSKPETNPSDPPPDDTPANDTSADQKDLNNPFSSLNKRFIVGFEQSGAASSDATGRPFFDIFINTPLSRNDSPCNPKLSANDNTDDNANGPTPCLPPGFPSGVTFG
jgi:hypothetical protein